MQSAVIKRSVVVGGHKTSVSLEDIFWSGIKKIADQKRKALGDMFTEIDAGRGHNNLSSAIRVFVFEETLRDAKQTGADFQAPPSGKQGEALGAAPP